jgi:hypothetical protein
MHDPTDHDDKQPLQTEIADPDQRHEGQTDTHEASHPHLHVHTGVSAGFVKVEFDSKG